MYLHHFATGEEIVISSDVFHSAHHQPEAKEVPAHTRIVCTGFVACVKESAEQITAVIEAAKR
jgi:hypothetical protein